MKKLILYTLIAIAPFSASTQMIQTKENIDAGRPSIQRKRLDVFAPHAANTGGLAGTGAIALVEVLWETTEKQVDRNLDEFSKLYGERSAHYAASFAYYEKVDDEINNLNTRLNSVDAKNEQTLHIFPFKKNRSKLSISEIRTAVNKLDETLNNLNPFTAPSVRFGELVNLKSNIDLSIEELDRKLNAIESEVDNSGLLNKLINRK